MAAEIVVSTPAQIVVEAARALPGDTLVMTDGLWPDADILFTAQGTADLPITLRAATLGRVHLTGQSRLRMAGNHLVVNGLVFTNGHRTSGEVISFQESAANVANNCRVTHSAIIDYNPPDPNLDTKWVGLYGVSNRVEYCYFRGKTNVGSTIVINVDPDPDAPNYHVLSRNHFGFRPVEPTDNGETIRIGSADQSLNQSRTTVEDNYFFQCNGDQEIISSRSMQNTFRRNTFVECEGALSLRHGHGSTVAANYFLGNRRPLTGGVRIVGEDHLVVNNYFAELAGVASRAPLSIMQGIVNTPLNGYHQVRRATVAYNTFAHCTNAFIVGLTGTSGTNVTTLPPEDSVIANNIVLQTAGRIVDLRTNPVNMTWASNIFWIATPGVTNPGILRVDPLLVQNLDGLWRPGPASPALFNAAAGLVSVTNDFEGHPRPGANDIGCDQASVAPAPWPPSGTNTTGPLWQRTTGTVITWARPADITYGMALGPVQLNASANAPGTYNYTPAAGTVLAAGTGQLLRVVFTPSNLAQFNVATQTVAINVRKFIPTVTWSNPAPITWGTALGPVQLNATANVPGTFAYTPAAGSMLNASNGQRLTVVFTPLDPANHAVVTQLVSIDVMKSVPVIVWPEPAAIEYGTALSAAQYNAAASVPGAFAYTPAVGTVLPPGDAQPLTLVFTPGDAANHTVVTQTALINVTLGGKQVPQVVWPAPAPILHGTPLNSLQLNATSPVAGTFAYAPGEGAFLPPGMGQVLSVTFTPGDTVTYTSVVRTVTIDVAALPSNALVRVAYLIPSNRVALAQTLATLRETVVIYRQWFAGQMQLNGFGPKTFTFETEADGVTPRIHILNVARDDGWLRGDIYGQRVIDALGAQGMPLGAPGQVWWLVPETHVQEADGTLLGGFAAGRYVAATPMDSGWAMSGSDASVLYPEQYRTNALYYGGMIIPGLGPYPLVQDISFPWFQGLTVSAISSSALGSGLRNFGGMFGLDVDYRNDENFFGNVMGFGFRGMRGVLYPEMYPYNYCSLSYAAALTLTASPYFNPGRPLTDTVRPTVIITTTNAQTPLGGLLGISFNAGDDQGLHAATLAWETGSEFIIVAEQTLTGTAVAGMFSVPYFVSGAPNNYSITVIDQMGNRTTARTVITPGATVNHAPEPYLRVAPVLAGPGEDVVFDVSDTFDPEHAANLLEVEWDIDGDGNIDTFPSNNYATLGTRLVRALVTDPAGASTWSSPVAVTIVPCAVTLSPSSRNHGYGATTGSVSVAASPKCRWTVATTNDWITVVTTGERTGPGTATYALGVNTLEVERHGAIFVGDAVLPIVQRPYECAYSSSATNRFHGFGTGTGTFKVTTGPDCPWTIENTNSWVQITSGQQGTGTVNVTYSLLDNRTPAYRSGNIVAEGIIFTITQWGTNCQLVVTPLTATHGVNAETGLVTVSTAIGCAWSTINTNPWISFTTVVSGTNSAGVGYQLAPNPATAERWGVVYFGDQSLTVTQRGCAYSIAPTELAHSYVASTGTVFIAAGGVCPWTASNTNTWIVLLTVPSGVGNGALQYAVTPNPSSAARLGTLTVAGQTYLVGQAGKPCEYVLLPDPEEPLVIGEGGEFVEVTVLADAGCEWATAIPVPWITPLFGETGIGSGLFAFSVAQNYGPARGASVVIAGQDFHISQPSGVHEVTADTMTLFSGATNCINIALDAHGNENAAFFSLCYATNQLDFVSAQLQEGSPLGLSLMVDASQTAQGRVGFTAFMPPGWTLPQGTSLVVRACFRAQTVNGTVTAPLTFCDMPAARLVLDALGQPLTSSFLNTYARLTGPCTFATAVSGQPFTWSASAVPWVCSTNVTRDGDAAAMSGPAPDGGESYVETTLAGPGTLTFWWKVSSEPSNDRLRFYLNGSEQFRISGEVDWEFRTVNIGSGNQLARWRYNKNSSVVAGADAGWVDEVVYTPAPPSITGQPSSLVVEAGANAVFTVVATGPAPLTYQWMSNGVGMADGGTVRGTRTATLTLSNVQPAQAGVYSVIVDTPQGEVISAGAVLTVVPSVPLGEAVDAAGFVWSTSGSQPWTGQLGVTHDGVDAARSGSVSNSQSSSFQTVVSGPGAVSFWWKVSCETNNDRVIFYVNGTEQARISGEVDWQRRTFNVGAGAQTLSWTYSKNGSVVAGQDRAWVDEVGFAPAPVSLLTQPSGLTVDQGGTASFSVVATGAPPLAFRWQLNGTNLIEGPLVRGTTNATLVMSNVQPSQTGGVSVVVLNPVNSVISTGAHLRVTRLMGIGEAVDAPGLAWTTNGTPPWVGQDAVSHDGVDGARSGGIGDNGSTAFQTVVNGPGTVSFWWKVSSQTNSDLLRFYINGAQQEAISGEAGWVWRSWAVPAGTPTLEWRYTKNASTAAGQDRGWVDQIYYVPSGTPTAPAMAVEPAGRTVVSPGQATLSAIAVGSAPLWYQWMFEGTPLADGAGIGGVNTTNLVITNTAAGHGGGYALVVTNMAGAVTSAVATLTVVTSPVITNGPVSQSVVSGSTVTFSVGAMGTTPLGYQWRREGTNLLAGPNIGGVTSNVLRLTNVTVAAVAGYSVVVSNVHGAVTSTVASLGISVAPTITGQPAGRSVVAGTSPSITVGVAGTAPFTFRWRLAGTNLIENAMFGGVNQQTLVLSNVATDMAGNYSVAVSNSVGGVISSNAAITVLVAPVISLQPNSLVVTQGAGVSLVVGAAGSAPLAYQWRRNGTNLVNGGSLSGATGTALTLLNAQPSQGGLYSVVVTNGAGSVTSAVAQLTVQAPMTLGEAVNAPYLPWATSVSAPWVTQTNITHDGQGAAQSGNIGTNDGSWIETTVVGPGTLRFWWRVSSQTNADYLTFSVGGGTWARISGRVEWEQRSFSIPSGSATVRWTYNKDGSVTNGSDRGWLDEVDFLPSTGPSVPVIVRQPASRDTDPNQTVTFSVEALGTAPMSYQWRFEGQELADGADVSGARGPVLTLLNVQAARGGVYDVVIRNPYSLAISEQVFLNVIPFIPIPEAVDTDHTNFIWITSGYTQWRGQTNVVNDRIDAVQSGALPNNQTNYIETTVIGPGAVTFWWKVSSQTNSDRLRFTINGVEAASIAGETAWQKRIIQVNPAEAILRWSYTKDATGSAGQDRGWVDMVEFGPSAPIITNMSPNTNIVDQGTVVELRVDPAGTPPFNYQWKMNGTNLLESTNDPAIAVYGAQSARKLVLTNSRPEQSGIYSVEIWNAAGSAVSEDFYVQVNPSLPVGPALNPDLVWETFGEAWWVGTTNVSHDGVMGARSGALDNAAATWLRTTVQGPGRLTFWWRASTQSGADILSFYINSNLMAFISGNTVWEQKTYDVLFGTYTFEWEYNKDALDTNYLDTVYLDEVTFAPVAPWITNQPAASQTVDAGSTVSLSVAAGGTPPYRYQWRLNDVPLANGGNISGATNSTLTVSAIQVAQAGNYSVIVSNAAGYAISSNALVNIIATNSLEVALDTTNITWVPGSPPWVGQALVSHDGVDSARSPALNHSQSSSMQTTVNGPGPWSFWWKVSSQTNNDNLIFYIDNVEQARISGEVGWQYKTNTLSSGSHTFKWTYTKNSSITQGLDRAWVDEFTFIPVAPTITTHPTNLGVDQGQNASFTVACAGTPPFLYQWMLNSVPLANGPGISGATNATLTLTDTQPTQAGEYSVRVSNPSGDATSSNALLTVTPLTTLAEALDVLSLSFTTNGTPPWVGQMLDSHDGVDAARSGAIGSSSTCTMQTIVTGPGLVSFWWKVSCETNNDRVMFSINGSEQARISGEVGWEFRQYNLASGNHTLLWTYSKNGSTNRGLDRAWVDQIVFGAVAPTIAQQPVSQNIDVTSNASFNVVVAGTPPFTYQWQRDGIDVFNGGGISGATSSNLVITGAQTNHAGSYRVLVSSAVGATVSAPASLNVYPILTIAEAVDAPAMTWATNGSPPWIGHGLVTHDGMDAARSGAVGANGSNSISTTVTGPNTLTFWWKVSSETNNDKVVFYLDGVEQARISGEVNWQFKLYNLAAGSHTLQWAWSKNGSVNTGADRAWVDQVFLGDVPPVITAPPTNTLTPAGANASFAVTAVGTPTLTFQWLHNGTPLANANGYSGVDSPALSISNVQLPRLGGYSVIVANPAGSVTSAVATLSMSASLSLERVLDGAGLAWTSGGSAQPWIGQTAVAHDAVDAAYTLPMGDTNFTWLKTTVNGPGTLTWWWKVSSETNRDYLSFFVDGVELQKISGEVNWRLVTTNIPAGAHELQWRYAKNTNNAVAQDRAWLDEVYFGTNGALQPPQIVIQPPSQTVNAGDIVVMSVGALGSGPLSYQWLFNGTNPLANGAGVSGAQTANLVLSSVDTPQAGFYSVLISNAESTVISAAAQLAVLPVVDLAEAIDALDLFVSGSGPVPWLGQTVFTHDGTDAAQSGRVNDGQSSVLTTAVNGPGYLNFWWKVSSETNVDFVTLYLNGMPQGSISGEVDWTPRTVSLGAGAQIIEWIWTKNIAGSTGLDRAWVDQVWLSTDNPLVTTNPPGVSIAPRITCTSNLVQVTWEANAYRVYRLFYKDRLDDPQWLLLDGDILLRWRFENGHLVPDFVTATQEDIRVGHTRFYRVLEY
jgi:poly(beta-D-mannuronate) lyase